MLRKLCKFAGVIFVAMVNTFIIDDHPAINFAIEFLLSEPEDRVRCVGSSLTMGEALVKMADLTVQVILLDLNLNTDSPVKNLKLLRLAWPEVPIVIYTAERSAWWKCNMFWVGANAFVEKSTDNEVIIKTILQVSDGSVLIPHEVKDLLNPNIHLAEAENITLEELTIGKDIAFGMSIYEIAGKQFKSPSSIEKHLRSMRKKTNTHSNPELIRVMISRNLIPF